MITKEELIRLYIDEGKTQAEVGSIYGCDRKNIDYHIKKYGIPKRSRKESHARLKKTNLSSHDIHSMLEEGMLIKEICDKYNVSRSAIYRITREAGMNFRNHKTQTIKQSDFMRESNPFFDEYTKEKAMRSSFATRNKMYKEKYLKYIDMDLKEYSRKARAIAYQQFKRGNLIEDGLVIDHKFSVKDGYENKIPLMVLSHPFNLRLIEQSENLSKGDNSIITKDELLSGVGVQRLS